jgi:prepilin-type N-terminal cleavage/methylation domain-containing protein
MLRRENGFTLLEVVIALSILAFGLLSIASMQVTAIRASAFAAGLSEATANSQQAIEVLLATPYPNMTNGNDTVTGSTGTVYARAWTVANPTSDYAVITVTTTYTGKGVQLRTVSLTMVRARD